MIPRIIKGKGNPHENLAQNSLDDIIIRQLINRVPLLRYLASNISKNVLSQNCDVAAALSYDNGIHFPAIVQRKLVSNPVARAFQTKHAVYRPAISLFPIMALPGQSILWLLTESKVRTCVYMCVCIYLLTINMANNVVRHY